MGKLEECIFRGAKGLLKAVSPESLQYGLHGALHPEEVHAAAVGPKGLLKAVSLFDVYTGKGVPEGKKSVAFSLELRADDRHHLPF